MSENPKTSLSELARLALTANVTPATVLADPFARSMAEIFGAAPARIEGKWFNHQRVVLDGYTFSNCRFDGCELVVNKGTYRIERCFFENCSVSFGGEALKVAKLCNWGRPDAEKWSSSVPTLNEDGTITII